MESLSFTEESEKRRFQKPSEGRGSNSEASAQWDTYKALPMPWTGTFPREAALPWGRSHAAFAGTRGGLAVGFRCNFLVGSHACRR